MESVLTAINHNSPFWPELFAMIAERGEPVPPVLLSIYRGSGGSAASNANVATSTRRNRSTTGTRRRTKANTATASKLTTNEKAAKITTALNGGKMTVRQIASATGIRPQDVTRLLRGQLKSYATQAGDLWSLTAQGQQRLAA